MTSENYDSLMYKSPEHQRLVETYRRRGVINSVKFVLGEAAAAYGIADGVSKFLDTGANLSHSILPNLLDTPVPSLIGNIATRLGITTGIEQAPLAAAVSLASGIAFTLGILAIDKISRNFSYAKYFEKCPPYFVKAEEMGGRLWRWRRGLSKWSLVKIY